MISAEFVPATAQIEAYHQNLRQYPTQLDRAIKRNTSRVRSRWLAALQVEPPPAKLFYPIQWKTPKQRAAFFATNGFGAGIPTQRSHGLIRAWRVLFQTMDKGGSIVAYNVAETAVFVYGDWVTERQPMFNPAYGGISWLDPAEVHFQFASEAEAVLAGTILTFDPFAGVNTLQQLKLRSF